MSKCIGGVAHDAVGSLATHQPSKSFGELFEEKKAQLDTLQAGLACAVLPKTPTMPAVKYSDSTLEGASIIILAYLYRYITRKHNVWARELDIYGRTHSEVGEVGFIPFLYQGQYLDGETGLAYNRFRYYSPETGAYISQDPIRLEAGLPNLYAYVHDVNAWVDPWGLISDYIQMPRIIGYQKHHIIPKSPKHPLLDRLGFDVHQHKNIIHLPTSSSIDPTRTVHIGRHTSNYDKMILSRLDEIEALDADDIIKRMHVNDLMENTGDDLRNNRIKLDNH